MKMTASLVVWPVSAISSLFTEILWKKYGMLFKKQLIFILKHAANEMKRRKSLIPARFHCAFLPIFTRVWRCRRMPLVKALISGLLKHWNMPYTLKTIFLTNQYVGGLGHTIWLGKSFCCGRSRGSWRWSADWVGVCCGTCINWVESVPVCFPRRIALPCCALNSSA